MAHTLILTLHLTAAAITGVIILFTILAVARSRGELYRSSALALGSLAAFEVFSGTLLAFVSPDISALSLTVHIAEYLSVCAVVEAVLFVKMRKISFAFPVDAVFSPVLASVIVFMLAAQSSF